MTRTKPNISCGTHTMSRTRVSLKGLKTTRKTTVFLATQTKFKTREDPTLLLTGTQVMQMLDLDHMCIYQEIISGCCLILAWKKGLDRNQISTSQHQTGQMIKDPRHPTWVVLLNQVTRKRHSLITLSTRLQNLMRLCRYLKGLNYPVGHN